MLKYVLSFFQPSETHLSLEDVTNILTQDFDSNRNLPDEPAQNSAEALYKEQCNFTMTTGKITASRNGNYIIDDQFEFIPEDHKFEINETVSYHKLVSNGNVVVYNVNRVNKDWDTITMKDSIVTTRVMVCKVEKREKRLLFVSPGNIRINLDKVETEFIPQVGDWLEIDVKFEVNQESLNLTGHVVEVDRIKPLRPHILSGKISTWNNSEQTGIIKNNIFFDKDSLICGYVPVVGDLVVAEIIESERALCTWRALKVLPEKTKSNLNSIVSKPRHDFKVSHPGLDISNCELNFTKLGETKSFSMNLTNNSQETLQLIQVEVMENCTYLDNDQAKTILSNDSLSVNFQCIAKTMGCSNELLLFHFDGFSVGKYINVLVNIKNQTREAYNRDRPINYNNVYQGDREIIRGQRQNNQRFICMGIPEYAVPSRLLDLVVKHTSEGNKLKFIEELKVVKKSLFNNLTPFNYEEKFHTLLHIDEISNIIFIRQYDQERAVLIPNGEFLMLEVENLAERRPSIVLGDKIMASDPLKKCSQEYEGNVFKVGAKHVYLKFAAIFHDSYNGEDYSIRVVSGRTTYKRYHHAIYLVARNLGKEWLFPNKVVEKDCQVSFTYDSYPQTLRSSEDNIESNNKRLTLGEFVEVIRAKKSSLIDQDGNKVLHETNNLKTVKLEWYNKDLNCKQKNAVINVLKGVARPLPYIIFGPPGTGKTVTVIECILQILRLIPGCRLLVTAPSNSAADLLALRLIGFGVLKPGDLVRLISNNYAVSDHIPSQLLPYCAVASTARKGSTTENVIEENGINFDCTLSVLSRHKITVSTCSAAGIFHQIGLPKGHFTHIFVDEAGQAAEPEVMIPISHMDKYTGQLVLAGDPMQLGPVIMSEIARDCGLTESFLERLTSKFPYARDIQGFPESNGFDPRLVTKLLHNYRSLKVILDLFSDLFYHGELIATISNTDSAQASVLAKLASILPVATNGSVPALVFHGVEGENYQTSDSPSWYNPHEAAQVFFYINEFLRLGLEASNIGIVTPYVKQVKEIRDLLREAEFELPKVGTVEDFQGQEFDVIIISTVRSSSDFISRDVEHSLGFVSNSRRLNVAISRPKALLIIVGNPKLLKCDIYWRSVIEYCINNGTYIGPAF